MKVAVIGAGAWGTALAITVARGGADTILWSYDGLYKEFDGVEMPHNLIITKDISDTKETDAWLIVTPSAFFRETLNKAHVFYNGQPIIICTKGAECSTGQFMSEILNDVLPECVDFGILSGPQFAAEVAMGCTTGSTLAGTDNAIVAGQQALLEHKCAVLVKMPQHLSAVIILLLHQAKMNVQCCSHAYGVIL